MLAVVAVAYIFRDRRVLVALAVVAQAVLIRGTELLEQLTLAVVVVALATQEPAERAAPA